MTGAGFNLRHAYTKVKLRHIVVATAIIPIALAMLALLGWANGWMGLVTVLPNARVMQPLTALGLMVCGLCLLALLWRKTTIALLGGLLLLSIAVQNPIQSWLQTSTGADLVLFGDAVAAKSSATQFPGRPSMIGSITFLLFNLALAGVATPGKWGRHLYVWASSLGLAIAFLALLGFLLLFGEPAFDKDNAFVMPVHTGLGMTSAFLGLLLLRPRSNWTGILLKSDWRGRTARTHIIGATFPAILALIASFGHGRGWYSADFRMLLIVLGSMGMIGIFVLISAKSLGAERNTLIGYAKALDLSPNFTLSHDGRILIWSKGAEQLYGWSRAEAVGSHCDSLLGWTHYAPRAPDEDHGDSWQSDSIWQGELHHRTRDGRIATVLARGIGYRLIETDAPVEMISVTDVTEERRVRAELDAHKADLLQLQAELLEVSRRNSMNEMAAALAHELNQPLTAASNFLGVVDFGVTALEKSQLEPGPTCAEKTGATRPKISFATLHDANRRAREELLRAGEIIRRLRDFIAGSDVEFKAQSISAIINNAASLALAGTGRVASVDYAFDPAVERVMVDPVQIQQVAVNLIRNAIDAMANLPEEQRHIHICTSREDADMLRVSITDSGPGLSPEIAATLFTPFVSSKRTGMGVGLSICRRIIEAHHGRIWATNSVKDDGTQGGAAFHFTLPLAPVLPLAPSLTPQPEDVS